MNKKIIIIAIIIFLAIAGYFVGNTINTNGGDSQNNTEVSLELLKPDRTYDLYGKVVKIEGNSVTVLEIDQSTDVTAGMSPAEKSSYMQSLSEEDRMALKELAQNSTLGEVTITIPVGILMSKKTASGQETPELEATLADVSIGSVISVWFDESITDRKFAEYVKISFSK